MTSTTYKVIIDYITKFNGGSKQSKKAVDSPLKDTEQSALKANKALEAGALRAQKLNTMFGQMRQMETFKAMGVDVSKVNEGLGVMKNQMNISDKSFDKMGMSAKKMSKGFDMSMLSIMFFGMFLQRVFGGIFSQMLNTFKMIDKKGTMPLTRSLNKMQAAFQFLSFRIMQSMAPILMQIIDLVVNLVEWFAALPDGILSNIGLAVGALAALGTALFVIGTLGLGLPQVITKLGVAFHNLKNYGLGIVGVFKNIGTIFGVGGIAGGVLGAAVALAGLIGWFYVLNDVMKNGGKYAAQFSHNVGIAFGEVDKDIKVSSEAIFRNQRDWQSWSVFIPMAVSMMVNSVVQLFSVLVAAIETAVSSIAIMLGSLAKGLVQFFSGDFVGAGETFSGGTKSIEVQFGQFADSIKSSTQDVMSEWDNLSMAQRDYARETERLLGNTYKSGGITIHDISEFQNEDFGSQDISSIAEFQTKAFDNMQANIDNAADKYTQSIVDSKDKFESSINDTFLQPIESNLGYGSGTPPTEGPLAETPIYAENFVKGYSDGILATAPYLNETITIVFTEATKIMESIVNDSVTRVIANVNRALAALRSLDAAKEKSSSTTNNYKTNNNKFNINGGSSSNVVSNVRKALAG